MPWLESDINHSYLEMTGRPVAVVGKDHGCRWRRGRREVTTACSSQTTKPRVLLTSPWLLRRHADRPTCKDKVKELLRTKELYWGENTFQRKTSELLKYTESKLYMHFEGRGGLHKGIRLKILLITSIYALFIS